MARSESKQSKAAFVRALPSTMSAKEVIEKAKAAGHKLTAAYVYVIRSKGGSTAGGKRGSKLGRPRGGNGSNGTAERSLINAALELGFGRARQLLDAAQARIRRSI